MHRDVALIVFYKDDKILLQDRRDIPKARAEWGFFGGGIKAGESPDEAVVRETKEELTYDLKEFTFVKQSHHKYEDMTFTAFVFVAPCPALSKFKQEEGQGMILVTEKEATKLKISKYDCEIVKYVFEFLRAGKNKLRK